MDAEYLNDLLREKEKEVEKLKLKITNLELNIHFLLVENRIYREHLEIITRNSNKATKMIENERILMPDWCKR